MTTSVIDERLKSKLRACLGPSATPERRLAAKEKSNREEEAIYREKYGEKRVNKSGGASIPPFYFALPRENEIVKLKLREEARAVFLQVFQNFRFFPNNL